VNPLDITNITDIAKAGLCNGCGTCYSVCSKDAISIKENERLGTLFAEIDEAQCTDCGDCVSVCPATEAVINNNLSQNKLIGNYSRLLYGYSLDDDLRYNASSGGIVSTLLRYLAEKNIIDGFVLVRPSKETAFLNEPFISKDVNDIYKYAGTRYFPIPVGKILKEIDSMEGKFAIVGTPCQIYGIRKYEKTNKKIKSKIYMHIGLFCGGAPNLNAHRYYMFAHKLKHSNLRSIYRGMGWPGNNVFEYSDGSKVLRSRQPKYFWDQIYYTLAFFPIFAQKRCLLCIDRFASFADISVGDAWVDIFQNDEKGTSLIISRDDKIDAILQKMREERYIYCDDISEAQVLNAQRIFLDFYLNFNSTLKLFGISSNNLPASSAIETRKVDYLWLIKLWLIRFGMKISEHRFLWRFLFIYGILFRYLYRYINILSRLLENRKHGSELGARCR
jgi:coenzyme F420 hydrogenase subunit beta